MGKTKILVDTNICLDAILGRKPFATSALKLMEHAENDKFTGFIAAHTFDTLFFILNKKIGKDRSYEALSTLRKAYRVTPISQDTIDKAIRLNWDDFEDAIHYQAALEAGCQTIITRNSRDFDQSNIPAMSTSEFLGQTE